jgi:hypothetical protein
MKKKKYNAPRNFAADRELASRAGKLSKPAPRGLMEMRKMKKAEFEATVYKYSDCTIDELNKHLEEKKLPYTDMQVISLMLKGFENGDTQRIGFLLDRTVGKVKDEIEVTALTHKSIVAELEARRNENKDK